MTIIQLEYFLAVANCGSFSQASEHCFVTQPSLSMQVKALEEELGVILLDRSKKPVIPTEAGKVVLDQIRNVLREFGMIREVVAEMKGETSGKMRLGVIPTIAPYLLHKFIPAFAKRYPKVELEIREMVTSDIVEALNKDRIDAALVAGGTCGDGIVEQELFNDRFYIYVSPNHPLIERTNIRIEDIDPSDLVLLSPGNCLRDQIIELCQASREMPRHYAFESGSLDTLMRIVDCTGGVTVIPEMAVEYISPEHKKQVKTLAKGATSRKIALAVRRTYVKSSIVEALSRTIMSELKIVK
ncbi:MAG: hydrogen peroxide-inducible genes activator [Alistipes sp.]|nr:hydrogen peroxide-inducible genes activator [Alistipes sp.]